MVRFIYPIQIYYIENIVEPITPYIAIGVIGGFILTGFVIKTMVVRLVRKYV